VKERRRQKPVKGMEEIKKLVNILLGKLKVTGNFRDLSLNGRMILKI
jgi:hypothetical protein